MNPDDYVHYLAFEHSPEFDFLATTEGRAEKWQNAFASRLLGLLGINRIAQRAPDIPSARLLSTVLTPDHVREEWAMETEPGRHVPFYILLPLNRSGRLPLVLTPHGHGEQGRAEYAGVWESEEHRERVTADELDVAVQAVRQGYIALAPEMRGFGGSRRAEEIASGANHSCRTMQMHALLFGRTLVGERVWDVQRLLGWALDRDDVDPTAVVITGNSSGGTVSLFTAAVDPRIRVCVPVCYYGYFESSIGSIHHCECNYIPGLLAAGEAPEVAGLIAPRHFRAVNGRDDPIFPIAATEAAYERLRAIYGVWGAEDRCSLYVAEGGHRYYSDCVWSFVRSALDDIAADAASNDD